MHHSYRITQQDGLQLGQWLADLPTQFDQEESLLYKGRNSLKIMILPNGDKVVVKRHGRPNHVKRLHNTMHEQSKGRKAYHNALTLQSRGLHTPMPVAFVEENRLGVFQRSYYVYRVDYGCTLASLYLHYADNSDDLVALTDAFAAYIARMHQQGVIDPDLNLSNVLCHSQEGAHRWSFALIDINRVRFLPEGERMGFKECVDTLLRLPNEPNFPFEQFAIHYLAHRGLFSLDNLDYILNAKRQHDYLYRKKKQLLRKINKPYYYIVEHL